MNFVQESMQQLRAQWREQQKDTARLDAAIEANLKEFEYGG
jgi:type I restriction enzyme M protein